MTKIKRMFSCPLGDTLEVFTGCWKPEIFWILRNGPMRFNELKREIVGVSKKMLTQQLRALQRDGLIIRNEYDEIPARVEYQTSELGRSLEPIFEHLRNWFEKNGANVIKERLKYDNNKK